MDAGGKLLPGFVVQQPASRNGVADVRASGSQMPDDLTFAA